MPNPVESKNPESTNPPQQPDAEGSPAPAEPLNTDWLHESKPERNWGWLLLGLMTLFSLGLHLLLLFLPVPEKPEPVAAKPEEKKVRITQLPTLTKPAARVPIAKPSPQPRPIVRRPVQRATVIPPIQPPRPLPAVSPAAPAPATTPADQSAAPASDANPWQDFPQYPGAQAGCYNLPSCMQTSRELSEVSAYFGRELAARKYSATVAVNEPNRQVYQVSRNNLTQFLSLLQVPGKSTVYVLAEQPRSLADLGDAVEVPAEIYSVLSGLAATDATRAQFAQPDAFYSGDSSRPEIGIMQAVSGESPDTFFDTYLRTNLVNNGFESTQLAQSYGGGLLYEVKKETASLYVNLVPTQDGSGTIVVVWKSLPK